jgi:hypothetical protein
MPKPAPAFAPVTQAAMPIEIEPDQPAVIEPVIEPEPKKLTAIEAPVREPQKPVEADSMTEALSPVEEAPKAFPVPSRPRLIASRPDPVGSVAGILAEIMEPAARGKVEIREVFRAYSDACRAYGKRPISANEFPSALAELCKAADIKIEVTDKGAYLLKVRLKKSGKEAAQ